MSKLHPSTAGVTAIVLCLIPPGGRPAPAHDGWSDDWIATLAVAKADDTRPILVKYEASWCGPCEQLSEAMGEPDVAKALDHFHLLRVDVDRAAEEAAVDTVEALPTMRVITLDGRTLREKVGLIQGQELVRWLAECRDAYGHARDAQRLLTRLGTGKLDAPQLELLVKMLRDRSPQRRSSAAGLLIERPREAATAVAGLFAEGDLRGRLAALAVLRRWTAPIDQLDPWQPETITDQRLEVLRDWAESVSSQSDRTPLFSSLSQQARDETELELDRLVRRGPIRDGLVDSLALVGPELLPSVMDRLKTESSDTARQRLSALRYRLIAAPTLAVRMPGASTRLASLESGPRREAARRLSENATHDDVPLLDALFGHPDPLIRELALRGLKNAGGGNAQRLVRLLDDPDKNVRAAVLKLWLDQPNPALIKPVSKKALSESDPGLLVYYIRLLKEIDSTDEDTKVALKKLAMHDDWQVRAEVANLLAEHVKKKAKRSHNNVTIPTTYTEIARRLLRDEDSFVLSKIVPVLLEVDQRESFDRLLEVAWKYPEIRNTILPELRKDLGEKQHSAEFLAARYESTDASDREFALQAMSYFSIDGHETLIVRAAHDESESVRAASARSLSVWLDQYHSQLQVLPDVPESDDPFGPFSGPFSIRDVEVSLEASSSVGEIVPSLDSPFAERSLPEAVKAIEDLVADEIDRPTLEKQTVGESAANAVTEPPTAQSAPAAPGEPPAAGSRPVASEQLEASQEYDRWLARWRQSPQSQLPWLAGLQEVFLELSESNDPETQTHATLAAVRLGADVDVAQIVRLTHHVTKPEARVKGLYPWLESSQRIELLEASGGFVEADSLVPELMELARRYDPQQADDAFWEAVVQIEQIRSGWGLRRAMMKVVTGSEYVSSPNDERLKPLADRLARRVSTIRAPIAKLMGLSILGELDASAVAELTDDAYRDAETNSTMRRDFARFAIASRSQPDASKLALAMLDDEVLLPVGLSYVAQGYEGIGYTETGSIEVPSADQDYSMGKLIVAEILPSVDADSMRSLLEHQDGEIVAKATFVLSVMGQQISLDALESAARKDGLDWDDYGLTQLLVLAIAHRNHDPDVVILEEIYNALDKEYPYSCQQFYWMIRIMTGPGALELRKRIRDEVGIENLI